MRKENRDLVGIEKGKIERKRSEKERGDGGLRAQRRRVADYINDLISDVDQM